jgi:hypothetical protein
VVCVRCFRAQHLCPPPVCGDLFVLQGHLALSPT